MHLVHASLVILLVLICCHRSSGSSTTELIQSKAGSLREFVSRRLSDLWNWVQSKGKAEDTFIGRCFGAARKLKMIMPVIIFKLGVILTTLAFLTIFSLKSMGLLVLLLLINTSGWAAKFSLLKHEEPKHWTPPQAVHFHIHQKKDGLYHVGHSGAEHDSEWYDMASIALDSDSYDKRLSDRLKLLNIDSSSYRR